MVLFRSKIMGLTVEMATVKALFLGKQVNPGSAGRGLSNGETPAWQHRLQNNGTAMYGTKWFSAWVEIVTGSSVQQDGPAKAGTTQAGIMQAWASLLEARHAWCAARGITFLFLCQPDSQVPARAGLQILDLLDPAIRPYFIYPWPGGALPGAVELLEVLAHFGAQAPGPEETAGEAPQLVFSIAGMAIWQREKSSLPSCILFGDDATGALLPTLVPHFSRLTALHSARLFYDLLRSERPAMVLVHTSEAAMTRPPPADFATETFSTATGLELPLPTSSDHLVIDFSARGNSAAVRGEGWSWQERDHVWMVDEESTLNLPVWHDGDLRLQFETRPALYAPGQAAQRLEILANGQVVGSWPIGQHGTGACRISAQLLRGRERLRLVFRHPDAVVPAEHGVPEEPRRLSLCMFRIWLRVIPPENVSENLLENAPENGEPTPP
jgi:hypothetical protein